jgi:hypothetical protein
MQLLHEYASLGKQRTSRFTKTIDLKRIIPSSGRAVKKNGKTGSFSFLWYAAAAIYPYCQPEKNR